MSEEINMCYCKNSHLHLKNKHSLFTKKHNYYYEHATTVLPTPYKHDVTNKNKLSFELVLLQATKMSSSR